MGPQLRHSKGWRLESSENPLFTSIVRPGLLMGVPLCIFSHVAWLPYSMVALGWSVILPVISEFQKETSPFQNGSCVAL